MSAEIEQKVKKNVCETQKVLLWVRDELLGALVDTHADLIAGLDRNKNVDLITVYCSARYIKLF